MLSKKKRFSDLFFCYSIILLPILYQYTSPLSFLSMGDFLLISSSILVVISDIINDKRVKISLLSMFFLVLLISVNSLIMFNYSSTYYTFSDSITIILKMIMYIIVFNICINHFDYKIVKKFYIFLVVVLSLYLIIQYLYHKIQGGYLPIYLKYDWLFSWEKRGKDDLVWFYETAYRFRPSSLFLEPGYYALFVLPALFISLIKGNRIMLSLFITFCLFLSASGAGILISTLCWGLWLFKLFLKKRKNKTYIDGSILPFVIVGLVGVIIISVTTTIFSKLFNSFDTRVIRGFMVYSNYNDLNKIFGVGINNVSSFMNYFNISTVFDEKNLNFGSTFSKSLMEFGIFGLLLLIITMIYVIKKVQKDYFVISLIILLFVYFIFEDMLFNFRMGFFFAIIIYFINEAKSKEKTKKELGYVR